MEDDDPEVENTIVDVGIGATDNVLENRMEEDVTSTTNEDDYSHASNDDDEENLDILVIEKDMSPYTTAPKQCFSLLYYCW